MNCKQGDLAYVFKSQAGNYGRVVTCLKLHPAGSFTLHKSLGAVWEVDVEMNVIQIDTHLKMKSQKVCADSMLRPLRADPTNDTTEIPIKEIA